MVSQTPTTTISEDELRAAHRELGHPVSFEVMAQCPALAICLRNLAEIRARRPRAPGAPALASSFPRFEQLQERKTRIGKLAAANDID